MGGVWKLLTSMAPTEMSVERFQHNLLEICGAFQAQAPHQNARMNGIIHLEDRAGFEIAHVAKDLHTIRRSKADISRDSGENFFLIVQEEGRALMAQNETAQLLQPGDMILIDSAEPSDFSFFGAFSRQMSIHLPRTEVLERFGASAQGGIYLPRSDYITMAMGATLAKAFEPEGNAEQSGYLREAVFGLLGALLFEGTQRGNARSIDADVSGADLLKRGLAYLDRMFKTNALTIQDVANDLGIPLRQLQRAFALIGTTPTDYLLQKRLSHACQLLRDRRNSDAKVLVSTIAYSAGFNDVSYFNRQFRKHMGCSPGRYGG